MSDFVEKVTKALALELDRKITGKPSDAGDTTATVIEVEQPVLVLDYNDDTFHGLSFDMFWFDEWDDYEGKEY